MPYKLYKASKSVLYTLYSVKKYLLDSLSVRSEVAVDARALGVDAMTIAGHKLYAPKGVGALFCRRGIGLPPLLRGAGQEGGQRASTENVPRAAA